MDTYYTNERNVQILIYLLKAHGIKKVVASPGTTNLTFVASIQKDSFFEIYSSADERSAAYMACGMAAESGEAVVLTCTGATASRNYIPGLTEAFYRKLPVLAVTALQHPGRVGMNMPQVIDRSTCLNDMVKISVQVLSIHVPEDEWACSVAINKALLELNRRGGGPAHINLETTYSKEFTVKEIAPVKAIHRVCIGENMPPIKGSKVAIFVGAHKKWNEKLTYAVDRFCEMYNGVVLCDHTSNYKGKYRIPASIVAAQTQYKAECKFYDLMIHIGDVSGAEMSTAPKRVWRVNPDGEVRDTFRRLTYVMEMEETAFFESYTREGEGTITQTSFYEEWKTEVVNLQLKKPELPFSNVWAAKQISKRLPENCVLHLGIYNSLRSFNYFEIPDSVNAYSNTGGFGIDGDVSSLIGASLIYPNQLFYGVLGDLAFFYDMNSIGNRHVRNNIRILLINNGKGTEFRNYNHPAARFGDDADQFMAAAGHYGNCHSHLVQHYAQDLGFEYMAASNKKEFLSLMDRFLVSNITAKPMLFEIFTNSKDESNAIEIMHCLEISKAEAAKATIKNVLGENGVKTLRKLIKH